MGNWHQLSEFVEEIAVGCTDPVGHVETVELLTAGWWRMCSGWLWCEIGFRESGIERKGSETSSLDQVIKHKGLPKQPTHFSLNR